MTLGQRLRDGEVLHMPATVTHARRGAIGHEFRHVTDYLLLSPDTARGPALFSRRHFNLLAVTDRDHGGPRGAGSGPAWAKAWLAESGLALGPDVTLALLTQPRVLGHWFTPVSFWMALRGDDLLAVIAEVNNTFGQRHSYLCRHEDFAPIAPADTLRAQKVFHVSPFQDVRGEYRFHFAAGPDRMGIRIAHVDGENGLDSAMSGPLLRLTNRGALAAGLRRPGGGLRVLALIHWHATRLAIKGAGYRRLPAPPEKEIS